MGLRAAYCPCCIGYVSAHIPGCAACSVGRCACECPVNGWACVRQQFAGVSMPVAALDKGEHAHDSTTQGAKYCASVSISIAICRVKHACGSTRQGRASPQQHYTRVRHAQSSTVQGRACPQQHYSNTMWGQPCPQHHYARESGSTDALHKSEHALCKGKHGSHSGRGTGQAWVC